MEQSKMFGTAMLVVLLLQVNMLGAQTMDWAIKLGGGGNGDQGTGVAVGASGNVYSTGSFISTGDFDPGPGIFNMTAAGNTPTSNDLFVSKVDMNGNFIWAKRIGGIAGPDIAMGLCLDASENVYLTGYFSGTVDFDPGPGIFNMVAAGTEDIFVCKLDAAGNFIWAGRMGGSGSVGTDLSHANAIAIDASGAVYITGFFGNTVDLDPGPGSFPLTSGGTRNAFICKLDGAGNFVFAKQFTGPGFDNGMSIRVDPAGNIYSTGDYSQTTDFDPGPGVANLVGTAYSELYISKLDAAGNFVWAKAMGAPAYNESGMDISFDALGNVYVIARFRSSVDVDPGPLALILTATGFYDGFITKLDNAGNFVWARQFAGTAGTSSLSLDALTFDVAGSCYITGAFVGTLDLDPGAGVQNRTGSAGDAFIVKLDNTGAFMWMAQFASTFYTDYAKAIVVDAFGSIYATGAFQATCDFDPGPGTFDLYTPWGAGGGAAFVVKLNMGPTVLPIALISFTGENKGTVNELHWATATERNNDHFDLQRSADGIDWVTLVIVPGAGNSQHTIHYTRIDPAPFALTYYRLKQVDFDGAVSLSEVIALSRSGHVDDLVLFPNPTTDMLFLPAGILNAAAIRITDILGRAVMQGSYAQQPSLDVGFLAHGTYTLRVLDGQGTVIATGRFVRK